MVVSRSVVAVLVATAVVSCRSTCASSSATYSAVAEAQHAAEMLLVNLALVINAACVNNALASNPLQSVVSVFTTVLCTSHANFVANTCAVIVD
jgi:hypothetical protein